MAADRRSLTSNQQSAPHLPAPAGTRAVVEPASAEWDTFVLGHPYGHLLQLSPWGRLKAAFGWSMCHVAVVGTTAGAMPQELRDARHTPPAAVAKSHPRILAGAQILFRRRYAVSVGYVPRGPLFSGDPLIDDLLLTALARIARRHRAVFLRLEPNLLEDDPHADAYHTWLLLKGFQPAAPIQPRSSIHLDLNQPAERLFASFSKGHRADIRRAERQGLTVRVGSADDIGIFSAIMQSTGARAAFDVHAEAYYRQAHAAFQSRSHLLLAEQDQQVVAGHMVFADARRGLYLYSGATEPGLKSGANHLLQWYAIQWACAQACTSYDFWGIPDALGRAAAATDVQERATLEAAAKHDPLIGVYRFKKGFGGRVVRYLPAYDQVYLPLLYGLWRRRFSRTNDTPCS